MKRDGEGTSDDLIYGLGTGVVRDAEVEVDGIPDVADELLRQRFVEPIERLESLNVLRALLVADVKRATRRGLHDEERERCHRQQGRDEPEDPIQGESQHAGSGLLAGVYADRGSDGAPGAEAPHRPSSVDIVAPQLPITSSRPN